MLRRIPARPTPARFRLARRNQSPKTLKHETNLRALFRDRPRNRNQGLETMKHETNLRALRRGSKS
jgi:hypothetical protein